MPNAENDAGWPRCTCHRTLVRPHRRTVECRDVDTLGLCIIPPAKRDDWHEFTEDVGDASMCVCGVPALTHDAVFPPGTGEEG